MLDHAAVVAASTTAVLLVAAIPGAEPKTWTFDNRVRDCYQCRSSVADSLSVHETHRRPMSIDRAVRQAVSAEERRDPSRQSAVSKTTTGG